MFFNQCILGNAFLFHGFPQLVFSEKDYNEYTVEKSIPLVVEISVAGNQKSTLFGHINKIVREPNTT